MIHDDECRKPRKKREAAGSISDISGLLVFHWDCSRRNVNLNLLSGFTLQKPYQTAGKGHFSIEHYLLMGR